MQAQKSRRPPILSGNFSASPHTNCTLSQIMSIQSGSLAPQTLTRHKWYVIDIVVCHSNWEHLIPSLRVNWNTAVLNVFTRAPIRPLSLAKSRDTNVAKEYCENSVYGTLRTRTKARKQGLRFPNGPPLPEHQGRRTWTSRTQTRYHIRTLPCITICHSQHSSTRTSQNGLGKTGMILHFE
jgi:hypothetical protein